MALETTRVQCEFFLICLSIHVEVPFDFAIWIDTRQTHSQFSAR